MLVHELVRLRVPTCEAAFWRKRGRVMPDCEERRAQLRELGARLRHSPC